jgi:hypothetical protein
MTSETKLKKFDKLNKQKDQLNLSPLNKISFLEKKKDNNQIIIKYQKLIERNKVVNKIDLKNEKESLSYKTSGLKHNHVKKNLHDLNKNKIKLPIFPKISNFNNKVYPNIPVNNKKRSLSFYSNVNTSFNQKNKVDLKLSKDEFNKNNISFQVFTDNSIHNIQNNNSGYDLEKTANFSFVVNMTESSIVEDEKVSSLFNNSINLCDYKFKKIEDYLKEDEEGFTFRIKNLKKQKKIALYKSYLEKSKVLPVMPKKLIGNKIKLVDDKKLFDMKLKDSGIKIAVNSNENKVEKTIKNFIPQFTFSEKNVETFTGKETEANSFTSSKKQSLSNFKFESRKNLNSIKSINGIKSTNSVKSLNDSFQSRGNSPKIMKNHPMMKRFFDN